MRGIDSHFQRLQPVALHEALEGEGERFGRGEAVELREFGRVAVSEPGEHDSVALDAGVGDMPDFFPEPAARRFGRLLQAPACGIEQPAVERAAQSSVLEPTVTEVRAPVRATPADQGVFAGFVAEEDQILAHKPHRLHRAVAVQFLGQRRRLPIAAHERTAGRSRPRPGHQFVVFHAEHPGILTAYLAGSNRRRQRLATLAGPSARRAASSRDRTTASARSRCLRRAPAGDRRLFDRFRQRRETLACEERESDQLMAPAGRVQVSPGGSAPYRHVPPDVRRREDRGTAVGGRRAARRQWTALRGRGVRHCSSAGCCQRQEACVAGISRLVRR